MVFKNYEDIPNNQSNQVSASTSKKVTPMDLQEEKKVTGGIKDGNERIKTEPNKKDKINLKTALVLTNQYNETTLIEKFKVGMNLRVTNLMKQKLEDGTNTKRHALIKKSLSPTLFDRQMMRERVGTSDAGNSVGSN